MTVRQVVWFIAGYVVTVAAAVWFNLAVLCQGDVKFDRGCGGFELYVPCAARHSSRSDCDCMPDPCENGQTSCEACFPVA